MSRMDFGDLGSIKISPGGICPKCLKMDRVSLIVSCGCGVRQDIGAAMVPEILEALVRTRELLRRALKESVKYISSEPYGVGDYRKIPEYLCSEIAAELED